jgi:predicted HicB family RNase H-like nuclease
MPMVKKIVVSVTESLHREIKATAAEQGLSVSEVLRSLVEKWLTGQVKLVKPKAKAKGRKARVKTQK